MKSVGVGSVSYKIIKKCLKEKLLFIADEIEKGLTSNTFLDEQATAKLKEQFILLDNASAKLSHIPYKKFSVNNTYEKSK